MKEGSKKREEVGIEEREEVGTWRVETWSRGLERGDGGETW